jgi:hypothetical protein
MIIYIHSDASYLSEREAKSRARGFFYMGSSADTANKLTNGSILIISTVLKHVLYSAGEAEIGAVFINSKEGAVLSTSLEELGHPQPPVPLETDNTTSTGYSNGTIKQKRTKAMNMRFYWIKDRVKQGKFVLGPKIPKFGRLFHKTPFAGASKKNAQYIYIYASEQPLNRKGIRDSALRGCVNTSGKAGAHILYLPLGDDSSPLGDSTVSL